MSEATTNTAPTSEALREIRDGRLYRTQFGTFEEYCQLRWGFTPQHSNRLVMAARVVKAIEMEPIGSITPQTESQARELTRLVEAAAEVVTAIGMTPIGVILPATESQARELTRLEEPAHQLAAWQAVVKAWAAARDAKLAELAAAHVDREIGTLPLPVGEFLDPAAAA